MIKLRKATKKITAIAASTAIVASAAFAGSYPSNFVKDGKFDGKVVVGANADVLDTTNAQAIIADLKAEFSGESEKVKLTYKKSATGGTELNAVRDNNALNYGEVLGDVTETSGFDDSDSSVLRDGRFKNGVSDEDYEQTLKLENGKFNYALKDEVVNEIQDGIYYADGQKFATYTIDMKSTIDLASSTDEDFVGKTIEIMGNDFTIGSLSKSSGNLTKLELIGGANPIPLSDGDVTTTTVEGKEYKIKLVSVTDDKILLDVNGQTESISEYDSEQVNGLNIAVTELFYSSKDSVKSTAEIVIGGQKITLEDGDAKVQINDKDIDDVYEDYEVTSEFSTGGFKTITLTYKVADDVLLKKGDSLDDVLFQAFRLEYEGTNEPEYTTVEVKVNDDDLTISGTTEDEKDFDRDFLHLGTKATDSAVWIKGNSDEDRIFVGSSIDLSTGNGIANLAGAYLVDSANLVLDLTNNTIKGSGFLLSDTNEEQYLYEISTVDTSDAEHEVDFDELLRDANEEAIKATEWDSKLGFSIDFTTYSAPSQTINVSKLGKVIAFENELLLDMTVAPETVNISATAPVLKFVLDSDDTDADGASDDTGSIELTLGFDDSDNEFNIDTVTLSDIANDNEYDNEDGDSDVQTFVNPFGVKVVYDNDEKRSVKIMVPEEQVEADVKVVFGGASSEVMTKLVDADQVEDAKAALEEEGYEVTGEDKVTTEKVEFDVTAVTLDSDVTEAQDMIVVGGPAVNSVARELLDIEAYTVEQAGVAEGKGMIQFFEESNSVLVYGYSKEDTTAAVAKLNTEGFDGTKEEVQ